MIPTVGKVVIYRISAQDATAINQRRADARDKLAWHHALRSGAQVHVGNTAQVGDEYPLMITKTWGDAEGSCFNGQLFLDGNDLYWVTSTKMGDGPRECYLPRHLDYDQKPLRFD